MLNARFWLAIFSFCCLNNDVRQLVAANLPPSISIVWPPDPYFPFGGGTQIRIKTSSFDPDGAVARVAFYAETNFIGAVTNPPFELIWPVEQYCDFRCPVSFSYHLVAVAEDNLGAQTESRPVRIRVSETRPTLGFVAILTPTNGSVFSEPATFVFSAELLAGNSFVGTMNFVVGTNTVGTVEGGGIFDINTPPVGITVSNLLEGNYDLRVDYDNGSGCQNCFFLSNTIRVVKLGIHSPRRTPPLVAPSSMS